MPVVAEVILARATTISMGAQLANITEFRALALRGDDARTAISHLD